MKSIRNYIRLRVFWGSLAVLSAGCLIVGLAIRHLDVLEFDAAMEIKARTLATLVLQEDRAIEVDFAGEFIPEFETGKKTEYFQFRLLEGSVIERSDMLGDRDLPFFPAATKAPVFGNLRLPDGRRGRFVQIVFPPRVTEHPGLVHKSDRFQIPDGVDPVGVRVVLAFARSRQGLDALLGDIYLSLAVACIMLVGLIALLVHIALRKGLKPLADLNAQISRLGPETLEKRIHMPDAPAEIAALPVSINSFMEELQAVAVRERRFTSDVAHELRTPVAEFRAACEVGAKWSDDPALVKHRFENLQESAVSMERMLDGLQDLSRADRGAIRIQQGEAGVASLVDSCWGRVGCGGDGSGIRLENKIDRALNLNTDPVKLEQIVFNLLNNAACYSPAHSTVVCEGFHAPHGAWELSFSNPASALDSADLAHVFERFWRKDASRTGGGHSGLGLPIVKSLANAMGVQVVADLSVARVFTIRLRFPAEDVR